MMVFNSRLRLLLATCVLGFAIVATVTSAISQEDLTGLQACIQSRWNERLAEQVKSCVPIDQNWKPQTPTGDTGSIIKEVASKLCSMGNPVSCVQDKLKPLTDACFQTPELQKMYHTALKMTSVPFSYICDDDAKRVKDFVDSDGLQCFKTLSAAETRGELSSCMSPEKLQKFQEDMTQHQGDADHETEAVCTFVSDSLECLKRHNPCDNKRPLELVIGLIHEMMKQEPQCAKHIPSIATHFGAPHSIVILVFSLVIPVFMHR